MGIDIKHLVPDRVKPSVVFFFIQALWRSSPCSWPWYFVSLALRVSCLAFRVRSLALRVSSLALSLSMHHCWTQITSLVCNIWMTLERQTVLTPQVVYRFHCTTLWIWQMFQLSSYLLVRSETDWMHAMLLFLSDDWTDESHIRSRDWRRLRVYLEWRWDSSDWRRSTRCRRLIHARRCHAAGLIDYFTVAVSHLSISSLQTRRLQWTRMRCR